ncbi:hypothetical protein [Nocardioides jishulii]|uniref:Enoyl reductase n=1 Tax=Nocardioides jishulii TaxID=2575440 RepID=A0A4U2YTK0_9ACTN|nr:hypothetical protein [Nocardioides jishulii]QCX28289.1 hypothetical protein FCL41_12740 [Nocardioides jishulii]TKI64818.1 hypothetical protein FC770_06830 [Nocardioides jishulii]
MRTWIGLLGAAALAWTLATPGAAHADLATPKGAAGGGETDDGYYAYAIKLTGDYSVGLAARVPRPAPKCWWTELEAPDPHNAVEVKDWFFRFMASHGPSSAGGGPYYMAASRYPDAFDDAIEQDEVGDGVTWYKLVTNPQNMPADEVVASGCTTMTGGPMVGNVPLSYRFGPFQTPPAEPVIDVRMLAEYAYSVMNLVRPELDWNPKISAQGNAALVNLPTWMWVRDPESVDTRSVTASVGDVSVTVTAQPGTMRVRSEAGSAVCSPDRATTTYSPGREESSACTVSFSKESYKVRGGFAVTATVPWTASWTGGGEGDTFPDRTVSETTYVPVSSSQALVTEVN